jgi:hypothetical protein
MKALLGFSLSKCMLDIMLNKVHESQLVGIICGTKENNFKELFHHYTSSTDMAWSAYEDKRAQLEEVYNMLVSTNRLIHPRHNGVYPPQIHHGYWLDIITHEWYKELGRDLRMSKVGATTEHVKLKHVEEDEQDVKFDFSDLS